MGGLATKDKRRVSADSKIDTGVNRQRKATGLNCENDKDEGRDAMP